MLRSKPARRQQEASKKPTRGQEEAGKRPARSQEEAPSGGDPTKYPETMKNSHFHEENSPFSRAFPKTDFLEKSSWGSLKPARSQQEARKKPARGQQEASKKPAARQQDARHASPGFGAKAWTGATNIFVDTTGCTAGFCCNGRKQQDC